jgi:hypothetical protein
MAFWDDLLAGGIKGMAEGVGSLAKDIRTAITGEAPLTSDQKAKLQEQLAAMEAMAQKAAVDYDTAQMSGQVDLLKIDAQSNDKFRSYGRPAAIWICVSGLAYSFLVQPLLPWCIETACTLLGNVNVIKPLPSLDGPTLMAMAGSLLGIGGMRTVERLKGPVK